MGLSPGVPDRQDTTLPPRWPPALAFARSSWPCAPAQPLPPFTPAPSPPVTRVTQTPPRRAPAARQEDRLPPRAAPPVSKAQAQAVTPALAGYPGLRSGTAKSRHCPLL